MDIQPESYLQSHRFLFSDQASVQLKALREELSSVQIEHPYIKGLGFFGSKVIGLDNNSSDIDLTVFYDASDVIRDDSTDITYMRETVAQAERARLIESNYQKRLFNLTGVPEHSVTAVDISEPGTKDVIKRFTDSIDRMTQGVRGKTPNPIDYHNLSRHTELLLRRFLLGVGEDLYKNREYILHYFENNSKGDAYFNHLMAYLRVFERESSKKRNHIPIDNFPKNIIEAKAYFCKPILI